MADRKRNMNFHHRDNILSRAGMLNMITKTLAIAVTHAGKCARFRYIQMMWLCTALLKCTDQVTQC